ncbi:uncharacterized protein LOC129928111 [Biomphalaria glabrata]|uniref:Uncharacterized protein LOC129928111 n=1 Tax=Biomphalaria glabrata TaxID=6526 RepID=A0A9W3BBA3_BIOGL|nr:uncharacterized protein LOC129928111 [Biomphalaria glabrata]XP_055896715.1 uncharacterized protein LOC129928111 [Biomphalaria glabrata]
MRSSYQRATSVYSTSSHRGSTRPKGMSTDERFSTDPAIVTQLDMFKPKLLTSLIREEKIKDINSRVTRSTSNSRMIQPLYTQEELKSQLTSNVRTLLFDKNGGLRKRFSWSSRSSLKRPDLGTGSLPPAPGCLPPIYPKLWTHPSLDSYEQKWLSHKRHLTSDFLSPTTRHWTKSYSLLRMSEKHKSRH